MSSQFDIVEGSQDRLASVVAEIERITGVITFGSDCYSILGVDRAANNDEIIEAYNRIVDLLRPVKTPDVVDSSMRRNLNRAILIIEQAYSTLSQPERRAKYDCVVYSRAVSTEAAIHREIERLKGSDRRKAVRFVLPLPVRVAAEDFNWQEVTRSLDVSKIGVKFPLKRPVERGHRLNLQLPLPPELRIQKRGEGLYLVTAIVRHAVLHEGAENLIGVEFLASNDSDTAARWLQPRIDGASKMPPRKKILVADDDRFMREVLSQWLTNAGYDVVLAEDGKIALEKAETERPDLVLTDGLMPKIHGFVVCKTLKQMPSPPKVLVLTAIYTKPSYKYTVRDDYGADEVLAKPIKAAELIQYVEKHLGGSSAANSSPEQPAIPDVDSAIA